VHVIIAGSGAAQQRFIEQGRKVGQGGSGNGLGGGALCRVVENRQPPKGLAAGIIQELPGVVEDTAQAAVSFRQVALASVQEIEAFLNLGGNFCQAEHPHPTAGQLDAQRQAFHQFANADEGGAIIGV